jgi:hypothetical protein
MPKINLMNIHHIVIYECDLSYNGSTPATHDCSSDLIKNTCQTNSFGLNNRFLSFFLVF